MASNIISHTLDNVNTDTSKNTSMDTLEDAFSTFEEYMPMYTSEEIDVPEEWKETFIIFDRKRDGTMKVSELPIIMRALGKNPTLEELKEIQRKYCGEENTDCKTTSHKNMLESASKTNSYSISEINPEGSSETNPNSENREDIQSNIHTEEHANLHSEGYTPPKLTSASLPFQPNNSKTVFNIYGIHFGSERIKLLEYIDFPRFCKCMNHPMREVDTRETIIDAFKSMDPENTGYIPLHVLERTLSHLGEALTEDEMNALLEIVTMNSNGEVNYVDLVDVMLSYEQGAGT